MIYWLQLGKNRHENDGSQAGTNTGLCKQWRMNMGVLEDEADHHSMAIFPGNDDHHSWVERGKTPTFWTGPNGFWLECDPQYPSLRGLQPSDNSIVDWLAIYCESV